MESISKGNFTLRILYEQMANIQKMGPVGQVMSMIPGMSNSDLFNQVCPASIEVVQSAVHLLLNLHSSNLSSSVCLLRSYHLDVTLAIALAFDSD